jgi:hypothetical protein
MSKRLYHIASDAQRGALVRYAMQKAANLARESFYHGLIMEAPDDEVLGVFARDAWETFSADVDFDYPRYARTLFLRAYAFAYSAYVRELPADGHPSLAELAEAFEAQQGLTPGQS